ncbi:MAG TPA: DUF2202 domain-containing protein [Ignavibacteria bacterium]|nr:DUF2202 domain-containing protein [Ignavibacteria bacterium]
MKTFLIPIIILLSVIFNPLKVFSQLSDAEINGILSLREEEKVAYDVYTFMFEKYESKVFKNIAENEKNHMDKIKELIDQYNLNDPLSGIADQKGVFSNNKMKALYDEMIMAGNYGLLDALRAAARFEETDIVDLRKYLSSASDQTVINTYINLESGSQDHLRALVKDIKEEGISYKPSYLSKEDFDKIMSVNKK